MTQSVRNERVIERPNCDDCDCDDDAGEDSHINTLPSQDTGSEGDNGKDRMDEDASFPVQPMSYDSVVDDFKFHNDMIFQATTLTSIYTETSGCLLTTKSFRAVLLRK